MDMLGGWSDFKSGTGLRAAADRLHGAGLHVFLISFACLYYLLNAPLMLGHYDLGWHLAAGDLIRDHGHVPLQDPWSFTAGDKPWTNLSWLWDVAASVVFQYTGLNGLVFVTIACGAIIAGYLASLCASQGASAAAVCVSVFLACVLYPSFVTPPNIYLAASPNTATMLFCVIFYGECLRRTRVFLLPPMMALWANLHGGFVLGFFIVGIFGGVALLQRDWARLKMYSVAGLACAVATLINPLGWHIYEGVTATMGHFVQASITEWQSYYANMEMPGSIPGIVTILAFIALELRYGRSCKAPMESRLLSWLFLGLGFYQFRYMSFFFLFSTVPLAFHIDRLLPGRQNDPDIQKSLLVAGLVGALALPIVFVRVQPPLGFADLLSEQDGRYLKEHLSHARLLNHWNVGGLVIFRTQGTVPVFVDGRAATAYPDPLLHDYFKLVTWDVDETAWDAVLDKYKIDAVLWPKVHDPLRQFLVGKRGWTEQYSGAQETLYVKPEGGPVTR